jgi:hypothetical protein
MSQAISPEFPGTYGGDCEIQTKRRQMQNGGCVAFLLLLAQVRGVCVCVCVFLFGKSSS